MNQNVLKRRSQAVIIMFRYPLTLDALFEVKTSIGTDTWRSNCNCQTTSGRSHVDQYNKK